MKNLIVTIAVIAAIAFTSKPDNQDRKYKLELTGPQLGLVISSIRTAKGLANFDETNSLLNEIDNQLKPQIQPPVKDTTQKKKP